MEDYPHPERHKGAKPWGKFGTLDPVKMEGRIAPVIL